MNNKSYIKENEKILCLASGDDQQGPIMAATGADVTVFDISTTQLEKDLYASKRDNLQIKFLFYHFIYNYLFTIAIY